MSTISTAERREAAARLRTLADGDSPMNERSVDALYTALGFPWSFGTGIECDVIRHLADLIDSQTCTIVCECDAYSSWGERIDGMRLYELSCGNQAVGFEKPRYCPECGMEVVKRD